MNFIGQTAEYSVLLQNLEGGKFHASGPNDQTGQCFGHFQNKHNFTALFTAIARNDEICSKSRTYVREAFRFRAVTGCRQAGYHIHFRGTRQGTDQIVGQQIGPDNRMLGQIQCCDWQNGERRQELHSRCARDNCRDAFVIAQQVCLNRFRDVFQVQQSNVFAVCFGITGNFVAYTCAG